jgi:catechol 2,3-dioxygenase-like lactoylglutathione lyase family enzyme
VTGVLGIHHVQVAMPPGGEADARAYYGEIVGLAEVPKPEELAGRGGCWFRGGGVEIHLGVEEPFAPARKAHPALVMDDLEALEGRLRGAGYRIARDTELPGFRRFYTTDPFGNRLEFLESR